MTEDPPADPTSQAVDAIGELHAKAEQRAGRHQRALEKMTALLGRPGSVYLILLVSFGWIGFSAAQTFRGARDWDPFPFPALQGLIGFSSLLATTLILISQNRQGKMAERRAQLALHVNLVSEQKITKLILLVEELRRDLPNVKNRHDSEADAMSVAADPHRVVSALEEVLDNVPQDPGDSDGGVGKGSLRTDL